LVTDRERFAEEEIVTNWEYLVVPLKDAAGLKKDSDGLRPERLNELGSDGWEAVGVSLKQGDLIAWPVVLLKRPVPAEANGGQ
jgi:hypothetical protein